MEMWHPWRMRSFWRRSYQNRTIADPRPVNLLSGEVYYRLSLRSVEIGLSGYVTTTRGESDVRHYYDDLAGELSNMELSAIDKLYVGAELGVTVRLTDRWSLRGAAAFSDNTDPQPTWWPIFMPTVTTVRLRWVRPLTSKATS